MNINATLIAQAISFAILIWFTVKFVWPLITVAIDERNKRISDGLAAAERGRRTLADAEKDGELAVRSARQRGEEIIQQADKRAAQIIEEAREAAKSEAERLVTGAKAEIEQEVARARGMLRDQVALLAVTGAEKILRREIDAKAHADLLNVIKQQL